MTPITITAETRRISEILDDACDKLHTAIVVLFVAGQIDDSAMELDEFQLTEIICNSMPNHITLEDLAYASKSELYRMCYDELKAAM
jgi:hypothetical protein